MEWPGFGLLLTHPTHNSGPTGLTAEPKTNPLLGKCLRDWGGGSRLLKCYMQRHSRVDTGGTQSNRECLIREWKQGAQVKVV